MNNNKTSLCIAVIMLLLLPTCPLFAQEDKKQPPAIELQNDEANSRLHIFIEGREALVYQYAQGLDMPHYWPMSSPSGKNMLVRQTKPYPHHRSFWFADTVRLKGGREVSTYNALYTGKKLDTETYVSPFRDHIRHVKFTRSTAKGKRAVINTELVWEMDNDQPVLQEQRHLVIRSLGNGEFELDITFKLTAAYGEVEFVSDDVHYAWPFLRLHTRFSGESGGIISTDNGAVGEDATNMKIAKWLDYSNTINSITEGVAVFQWPDGQDHRWLTREYGCFGPRRPDDQSGKPFILQLNQTMIQRVGILVHNGGVKSGKVAQRYKRFVKRTQSK